MQGNVHVVVSDLRYYLTNHSNAPEYNKIFGGLLPSA